MTSHQNPQVPSSGNNINKKKNPVITMVMGFYCFVFCEKRAKKGRTLKFFVLYHKNRLLFEPVNLC